MRAGDLIYFDELPEYDHELRAFLEHQERIDLKLVPISHSRGYYWLFQYRGFELTGREHVADFDRSVALLVLKIGRYPLGYSGLGAVRSLGRVGVPTFAVTEDRFTPLARSRYLTKAFVAPTTGLEDKARLVEMITGLARQAAGPRRGDADRRRSGGASRRARSRLLAAVHPSRRSRARCREPSRASGASTTRASSSVSRLRRRCSPSRSPTWRRSRARRCSRWW